MATGAPGRLIVYTGEGKGKTTAALGTALRAVGRGVRVVVVQFLKAAPSGEHAAVERLAPDLVVLPMGRGWVRGEPTEADRTAGAAALAEVRRRLADPSVGMVVADEVLTAAGLGVVPREAVEDLVARRPPDTHLVLTGRGAWPALLDRADLVTEMREVKHPYRRGEGPVEGIEY